MNGPPHGEGRPGERTARSQALADSTPIVTPDTDDWQRLAAQVDGAFAVIVETSHGKYRRRVWFTLAAAERAVAKAEDAGHNAVIMLAELKPLYRVEGTRVPSGQEALGRIVDARTGAAS